MNAPGAIFYRGPSLLTGDQIIGVATGLEGDSHNAKTGPMVQAWILRPDLAPMDAVRENVDDAICGTCALRGRGGHDRKCYVTPWLGPSQVWKRFVAGEYIDASWRDLHALVEARHLRLGAYGDPGAIPFEVWRALLVKTAGWVGYTHAWRVCDPRLKTIVMASVDTENEVHLAHLAGWRTFRVRLSEDPLIAVGLYRPYKGAPRSPLEFVCPASDEAGHRTTCQACQLCRGTSSPARSVAILAHGKPSTLRAYGIHVPKWFGRRAIATARA
jgi:hypothetical protein